MRGADLINALLPDELLDDVFRRVGTAPAPAPSPSSSSSAAAGGGSGGVGEAKRDLDACALVCRRWRRLERASRRSARLAASGDRADEVARLVAQRFPALAEVAVDERLTASGSASASASARSPCRSWGIERGPYRAGMVRRRRRVPLANLTQIAPFPLDQPASDQGTEHSCLTDVGLAHLASGCRGLEKLSLVWCSAISSTGLVSIAEHCKKLTSLDLQACFIGDPGLIAIGEGCKLLRKLNLRFVEGTTDEGLIGLVKNCGKSLVSLSVANCQWLTDASLQAVGSHCPNLEILSVESDSVQSVGIISIARGCRQLKTLKLQCIGAGDDALDAVGSFCPLLEILSLSNFEGFTDSDSALSHVAQGCKNLTELSIRRGYEVGDGALLSIAENCKLLRELTLQFCERVSDAGLSAIAENCPLNKLNLCGCQLITDSGLTAIARGCPDLVFLDISVLRIISDIALAEIGDGCPKLKEIALSHCPDVTNVGLDYLVRGCQQLESCQMVYCRRITSSGVATVVSGCTRLKKLLVEEWKVSERTRRRAGPVLSFLCTGL